jgi:hypothetical protein
MNKLLLMVLLMLPAMALANAHHHYTGGGSSGSTGDGSLNFEGACLEWADPDGGTDGGTDGGVDDAEAADAGHPGQVCVQRASLFGCSSSASGPLVLLAFALAGRSRRRL